MSRENLAERLEMLLVMRWLDEGADQRGELTLSVASAADELGLDEGRAGMLAVLAALGELEERRVVSVAWPSGSGGPEGRVTLAPELRTDARRLFGRA